jgi:hypothetical protein
LKARHLGSDLDQQAARGVGRNHLKGVEREPHHQKRQQGAARQRRVAVGVELTASFG